jgi:hypothetical protein
MCTRFILHSLVSCSSKSGSALLYFRPSDLHLDRAVARSAGNFTDMTYHDIMLGGRYS